MNRMHHQRGAVLILALTLLMALAALTLASFQGANIQQLLAAGHRDREGALATAAATQAEAQQELMDLDDRPASCSDGSCGFFSPGDLPLGPDNDWRAADASWWQDNGTAAGGGHYVVEYAGFVPDDLGVGRGNSGGRDFYRVIARASGDRSGTQVIVETVYARRFAD